MPRESMNWTQKTRERLRASSAIAYLVQVANGEQDADAGRMRAAEFIANKLLGNPPIENVNYESDKPPDFNVIHEGN